MAQQIKAEEISQIIRAQIKDYDKKVEMSETGVVLSVGDGIARVYGVENAMSMELLEFPGGILGMALNLEEDNVGVAILGEDTHIKEGDTVKRTGQIAQVPVGDTVIGRVVDSVGAPMDGKGPIEATEFSRIEMIAPGVVARQPVKEPMYTGYKAIDSMTPIGRGQRELIIGDRQIGKTALAVDAIINQKDSDVICIYVAIGQKKSTVAQVVDALTRHGALCWMRHGRVLPRYRSPRPYHLRRPIQTGCSLSSDLSVASATPGSRGLSRRHLLQPLAFAGAGCQAQR
jgi:F-type H+-transporting ATPase subunit alpha